MNKSYYLILDIGTTGIKALVFDSKENLITKSYEKLNKSITKSRVEQDPYEILNKSKKVLRQAIKQSKVKSSAFKSLGITNQRETIVAWNKETGKVLYPAIVWEDSRTKKYTEALKRKSALKIKGKTGLPIIPYFSASKMNWILKNVPSAKILAQKKQLLFGTLDTWVLWNFDQNHPHLTDQTNAARTLLYNIRKLKWDDELLKTFGLSKNQLPEVKPSHSKFGKLKKEILGFPLEIQAMCGDQQSSTFAAGIKPGDTKITFGTGTIIVQILPRFILKPSFYTTLVAGKTHPVYALEAKIDSSGKQVTPVLNKPKKLEKVITQLATKTANVVNRLPKRPKKIIVDGGISQNNLLIKLLGQKTKIKIERQKTFDGTALGIAKLLK